MKKRVISSIVLVLLALLALCVGDAPAQTSGGNVEKAKALYTQAEAAYLQGRYMEAARLFKQTYDASAHAELFWNMGQCYRKAKSYDKAITAYQRFIKDGKNKSDIANAHLYMGDCLLLRRRTNEAKTAYTKFAELKPNSALIPHIDAAVKARKPLSDMDKRDPQQVKQAQAQYKLAEMYYRQGKYAEAAKAHEQGWQKYKMPEMLSSAGFIRYQMGQNYEAAKLLEQRLKMPGAPEWIWFVLTECYAKQGMVTKTRATWQRYLQAHPNGAYAQHATKYINTPQTILEKEKAALKRYNQGMKHYRAKRYKQALQEFQASEKILPSPNTTYAIGLCHVGLKEWKKALTCFEGALTLLDRVLWPTSYFNSRLRAAECLLEINMPNKAEWHVNLFKSQAKGTRYEKQFDSWVRRLEAKVKKVRDTENPNPADVVPSSGCAPGTHRTLVATNANGRWNRSEGSVRL